MSIQERDPVYIVMAIRDMITELITDVIDCVDLGFERQIAEKEKDIKTKRKDFAEKYNETPPQTVQIKEHRKTIDDITKEIKNINVIRDKMNISALIVDMGIHNTANAFLVIYGVAAADTPKFQLKGSGDIILKADKQKDLYVTKHEVGGSPMGAVHEVTDTVSFFVKAANELAEWAKAIARFSYETIDFQESMGEYHAAMEKADEKADNEKNQFDKDLNDNKPSSSG
jgi:hypothetical protein